MRQSPSPSGAKSGASTPAMAASMLSPGSTSCRRQSKLCSTQITIEATKITVNARCRKSLVLSQRRCPTFFAPGMR